MADKEAKAQDFRATFFYIDFQDGKEKPLNTFTETEKEKKIKKLLLAT